MLAEAGLHTLLVNQALLGVGFELKDGHPSNILFQGCKAIFIDHTSPTQRVPGALGWRAYGQFSRTFVIPLLAFRARGITPSDVFLTHRDGVPPDLAAKWFGLGRYFHRSTISHVVLPTWLGRMASVANAPAIRTSSHGDAATRTMLRNLTLTIQHACAKSPISSVWSNYQAAPSSYSPEEAQAKDAIIHRILQQLHPEAVLDLGSNTGQYALMASDTGAQVVAVDSDPASVERLFRQASCRSANVLPMVMNIGRPSPSIGWNNSEQASFLDRADGRFDLLMMLALVHHLLVTERIPLPEISAFAAKLTTKHALIEWIDPTDDHFLRIAGIHAPLYKCLNLSTFLDAMSNRFTLEERWDLKRGQRHLLLMRRKH